MKKVGIITLTDYNNYGNRLQNYALQETIKKMNIEVITVKNYSSKHYISIVQIKKQMDLYVEYLKEKIWKAKTIEEVSKAKRYKVFKEFSDKYINETDYFITEKSIPKKDLLEYSYFIAGSDQVWNPYIRNGNSFDFLTFAPKHKRVSYAASFGVSEIPEKFKNIYSDWLNEIEHISVREQAGADIVKKLTNKNVPTLVDPTMLLSKKEWLKISKQALNRPSKPYILTYMLGKQDNKKIKGIAKKMNLAIINLGDISEKDTYITGPSEFIDYINNASAFFTDSFHGVIFSIILETPFVVYERESSIPTMYSRISTLLDRFEMRDREAKAFDSDIFSMDFSRTKEVLNQEYQKSIKYLKDSLGIEE